MRSLLAFLLALSLQGGACETIGHVNHNPGNLSTGLRPWAHAIGRDAWGHLIFPDDQTGLWAIKQTLQTYRRCYRIHSIEHLCGRWVSPKASAEDKQNWIRTVRQRTHTKPGTRLNFADPQMAKAIAHGIVFAENSCDDIPEETYDSVFSTR